MHNNVTSRGILIHTWENKYSDTAQGKGHSLLAIEWAVGIGYCLNEDEDMHWLSERICHMFIYINVIYFSKPG